MENGSANLPTVAVLMATYNGARYLPEQLDSILAQQGVNVLVYIRDDGSNDNTTGIAREYSQRSGRVFLLDASPAQMKVTKNFYSIVRDIDLSVVDYIAYSDQDDVWLNTKLSAAVTEMQVSERDCYASNLIMGDAEARPIKNVSFLSRIFRYLLNRKSNRQLKYDHYFEAASAGCTLVLNKRAAQYFQKRINELYDRIPSDASHDWSTYAITRLGGFNWFIDKNAYIIYRQHTENAYGANFGISGITKLLDLFRSGWYRRHILMIEDLYNNGSRPSPIY
jgi:rhamnosyltransferase